MPRFTFASVGLLLTLLFATTVGCEIIAGVDRSKIPPGGTAGAGGAMTQSSSSSGTTSSSGTGGTGGSTGDAGPPCKMPTDCPAPANECVTRTCTAGTCGTQDVAQGTKTTAQTAGDCKQSQCDGKGAIISANDDTDLPDDNNDCTDDVCTAGVASNPPKAASTKCGANNALFCNGSGACVGCVAPTDCAGTDTDCHTRTCTAGACGVSNAAQGKMVTTQTAGDCQVIQCDGNGATQSAADNADVPVDGNTCTKDLCTSGVPSNPPEDVGTVCSQGSGTQCDGTGTCVQCLAATDCPGQNTECKQHACNAGTCGTTLTPLGTPLAMQTAGDCQKAVCDGNGATTTQADNTDLPDDNDVCTNDLCTAGVPSHTNLADGASCGGSLTCLAGVCSGCAQPTECPGVDDECKTRTCNTGLCGFSFTASGTAVAAQTSGDCQKNQCDGAGNTVSVADDTDVPADDGNQCTGEACNSGVPSHPTQPINTACSQNGGTFCSAAGACVQCNGGGQCPGADTDCQTRSCTANACGFTFQPPGTVTSTQTPGDCQVNQCDGTGGIVSVASNGDVPADDGNQCTSEVCNVGVPSHPAVPVDTACTQNGGAFCSAAATCVQCNTPTECPGTDTDCQARSCSLAGVCGSSKTPAGTPTTTQTPGDCHQNQCDGNGNVMSAVDNTDIPADDGNQCTAEVCTAGVPSHPAQPIDTVCSTGGGAFCNGAGTCVQCNTATECPGSDTECQKRTCSGGTCGSNNTAAGTPTTAQTPGDCRQNQCDGNGNVMSAVDSTDVPADDGNQCTAEVCTGGVPAHPPQPIDTACAQGGGAFCNAAGSCVQCNAASECPGTDTECHARTCTAGACGMSNTPAGTPTSAQTPGDCQQNQCDGGGNVVSVPDGTDVPADDGNQCTAEVCTLGVPSHPPQPIDTACNQGGGAFCDGAGSCVQCNTATECPGSDTECEARTCLANACGVSNTLAGTPTSAQTPGDCQQNECDGIGNIVSVADNADVPADDGNQCTAEICTTGVPSHPDQPLGTACSQMGGSTCDGAGSCVAVPQVASTSPTDATTPVAAPSISVTFTVSMAPATLTGQTTAGACSGSIQVSLDGFASCVAFSSAAATMSGGNTTATLTAAPGLLVNRTYQIRVTTAAQSALGLALPSQFTQPTGFTTTSPNVCNGSIVVSQVYGGGGGASPTYGNDYIELHNRGTVAVNVNGWAVQYAAATGTTWTKTALPNVSIQPGAYFLVQEGGGSSGTFLPLPTPDATGTTAMAATAGKVALTSNTTTLSGSCPTGGAIVDLVGYGATASCFEGAPTAAPSSTTAVLRVQSACADVNNNPVDFAVGAPSPRNSVSAAVGCGCLVENESNAALEADYCDTQFQLSMNVAAGATTPTVFGRLFEAGVTGMGSANAGVRAQVGFGPTTANPEYQAGWSWTNAIYNTSCSGCGNNDEYTATFVAPTSGTYNYVYRFSLDQGVSWTYCDNDQDDFGAGSNAGLTFSFADEAVLTVP